MLTGDFSVSSVHSVSCQETRHAPSHNCSVRRNYLTFRASVGSCSNPGSLDDPNAAIGQGVTFFVFFPWLSVRLQQVSKTYPGGVTAVDHVDLDVQDREFVVLVGPSGCGKTTTLRMIAGLEDISQGNILIGDRVVNHVAPKDRDIAMVFQDYALYPHMTVYKNLAFALKLRKVPRPRIDERVQWAARLLGLVPLLQRRPRELSGGQRQRVAVGRAIVREPQVFLFDEPLSNLDAKLRVTTRAELKKLQRNLQTTTIYVTHDQEEAMTLGDRVVVMHHGKIQQYGSPLEIYKHPANRFVAGFVGMPPMNFVDGHLQPNGSELQSFHGAGLQMVLPGNWSERLNPWQGQPVSLGIRPEAIRLNASPAPTSAGLQSIPAQVEVVEILGATMDVTVAVADGLTWVSRVATDDTRAGDAVWVQFPLDQLHLFANSEDGCGRSLLDG